MAGGKRAVFFRILGLLARGAAAAVFGLVANGLVVKGLSAVGDAADDHAQGASFASLGAQGPLGVDGAHARPAGDRTREFPGGAGEGGEGHADFIGRLAGMSFTHIRFP